MISASNVQATIADTVSINKLGRNKNEIKANIEPCEQYIIIEYILNRLYIAALGRDNRMAIVNNSSTTRILKYSNLKNGETNNTSPNATNHTL